MCWPKIRPGFLMCLLIWVWHRYLLKGNCQRSVQPSFKSHLKYRDVHSVVFPCTGYLCLKTLKCI